MAELLDAVLKLGTEPANMRSLAKRCDLGSSELAGTVYDLAAQMSIRGLTGGLNTPAGKEDLLVLARGFHWVDRDQPTRLFTNADNVISEELTQRAFGKELEPLVAILAGEAGVSERSAQTALEIAVGITVLMAAAATGGDMSEASLIKISEEWSGPLPEPLNHVDQKTSVDQAEPIVAKGKPEKRPLWIPVAAAGVVILAIGAVVSQLGGDSSSNDATAVAELALVEPGSTTIDEPESGADPDQSILDAAEDDVADELGDGDESMTESVEPANPIVSLSVPMTDTVNLDNDATGTLHFDFNTETGEVCYSVTSKDVQGPYRSHIHVGHAGEKGGIVVDLGPLDNGATGCLPGFPADTAAMLTDREGHYAELHDLSEDWTIRAQLSEGTEGPRSSDTNIEFEVGSGGASIVIDDDNILLEGQVPDQETAAGLAAALTGLGEGITVTSNLEIVSGAPAPSGRIFLTGAVFGVNSADMPSVSAATEATLTTLLESKSDWSLTAVGRTDGLGSELDNLELSLLRARTLRSFLADLGISEERVRVRGAGEIDADLEDTSSAGLESSRRAEFEFLPQ